MNGAKTYLEDLEGLAAAWQAAAGSTEKRKALADRYLQTFTALRQTGWNDSPGWRAELPDEHMPADYLNRRAELIELLLGKLSDDAMGWRASKPGSMEEQKRLDSYTRAMEELFRIGHWSGEPEVDSQLPDALMPDVYKKYWEEKLKT